MEQFKLEFNSEIYHKVDDELKELAIKIDKLKSFICKHEFNDDWRTADYVSSMKKQLEAMELYKKELRQRLNVMGGLMPHCTC